MYVPMHTLVQEMPVPCARVVCEPKFLAAAIQLLDVSQGNINTLCAPDANMESDKLHVPATPKWLQALLTFIDIWGKTMKIAKWWRPERDVSHMQRLSDIVILF